jgi:hypothetical protein
MGEIVGYIVVITLAVAFALWLGNALRNWLDEQP